MADIRNDQYLHRPGAGRGAITPADPLEVLLHSGGQPISGTNRLPVEATLTGSLPAGSNHLGSVTVTGLGDGGVFTVRERGVSSFRAATLTIGDDQAVELVADEVPLPNRYRLELAVTGSGTVYIGNSDVSPAMGIPLTEGSHRVRIDFANPGVYSPVYAIADAPGRQLIVVEVA